MRVPSQIVLSLALLAAPAYGAEAPSAAPDGRPLAGAEAPPGSAQIAFVSGNVAIYQLGQTDWTRAAVDLPIGSGDWLATDAQGRAEIRRGADALDVASGTKLNFANLHAQVLQVAISSGRIDVRLDQPAQARSDEIDLPNGAVWPTAPGTYDVSVGTDGRPTRIAVFEGSARFTGGGLDQTIPAGNALVVRQAGANLTGSVERATPDEFVKWSHSRDNDRRRLIARAQPAPATAPTTGSSDQENAPEPGNAAAAAPAPEHPARVERHRRLARHHYVRAFHHHRHYGYARSYGYAPAPLSPFSVLNGLLSVVR